MSKNNAGLHYECGTLEHEKRENFHTLIEWLRALVGRRADKQGAQPEIKGEFREEHKARDGKEIVRARSKIPEANVKAEGLKVNNRPSRPFRFIQVVSKEASNARNQFG